MLFLFIQSPDIKSLQKENINKLKDYININRQPRFYHRPVKVRSIKKDIVCVLYTHIDKYSMFYCVDMCKLVPGNGFEPMQSGIIDFLSDKYSIVYNF